MARSLAAFDFGIWPAGRPSNLWCHWFGDRQSRLLQASRGTTMDYYAGIDVSLEQSSVCVLDAGGKIVREAKVASEPEALIAWLGSLGLAMTRIRLEAGAAARGVCG